MLSPKLEERLRNARLALDRAASENIVELCKQYLALLAECRDELYRLPDTLELNHRSGSSSSREEVNDIRKAVRAAIEHTTQERRQTEALLRSFTVISGYGAVGTLNRQKYMGRDDWKLSAGGASFSDDVGDKRLSVVETVDAASLLRREEHVAKNAVVVGACPTTPADIFKPVPGLRKETHDDSL